eukprot:CCRYP_019523-RA/>CCRYP_019523-RA protein AED:0.40 eAED:0.40 QI:0/0/0/1/0/0/3/0/477
MGRTYQEQNRRRTHPSTQPALQRMKACGIQPTRQVLDNEISAAYKLAITASGMTYQLVPPDDHRRNIAEKAIQTWKDHFIAWHRRLNFPSTFGANYYHKWSANSVFYGNQCMPHISSHTHLYGHHDYNTHPFVPLGMEALVHDKPHRRKSFAQYCTKGYVIGTSHEHYRCWKVWTPTGAPPYITNPSVTPADSIIAAAANLSHLLTNNLQAHHNNKVNQSDLTRLQILTQPSPPPQHSATHYQQHSPNATHPSSPATVSDYDSNSGDSGNESINIPHPVPRLPLQPPRVSPQQTKTPLPRVSALPTSPAYNTRSHAHTITQETILHLLHNTGTPLTPQSAATRQFPCDALSAILDTDTGELLEYRHLIKNPKYCTIWKNAYGKELGRLAQGIPGIVKGTNTIVFIAYNKIPPHSVVGRHLRAHRCQLPTKKEDPYRVDSQLAVTGSLTLATAAHQQLTCSPPRFSSTASSPQKEHGS